MITGASELTADVKTGGSLVCSDGVPSTGVIHRPEGPGTEHGGDTSIATARDAYTELGAQIPRQLFIETLPTRGHSARKRKGSEMRLRCQQEG